MTLIVFCFHQNLLKKIQNYEITLDEAINYQTELKKLMNKLNNDYNPRNPNKKKKKKMEEKNKILESAEELFDARENIVDLFKEGTFPNKSNLFETKEKKSEEESEEESEKERIQKIIECIENESKVIDSDLFKNYFDFLVPRDLAKNYLKQEMKRKTMSYQN